MRSPSQELPIYIVYVAETEGATSLMMQADLALYGAKAAGRNRVRIFGRDYEVAAQQGVAGHSTAA